MSDDYQVPPPRVEPTDFSEPELQPTPPPPVGAPVPVDSPVRVNIVSPAETPVIPPAPQGMPVSETGLPPAPQGMPITEVFSSQELIPAQLAQEMSVYATAQPPAPEGFPASDTELPPAPQGFPATDTELPLAPQGFPATDTELPPAPEGLLTQAPSRVSPARKEKKSSKKPLIISLAAVAVVLLVGVAAFAIPELMRSNAYDQAMEQFELGNYAQAHEGFLALEDYKEAEYWTRTSFDFIRFEDAVAVYDRGEYKEARELFALLEYSSVPNIAEWLNKCDYAIADGYYAAGDLAAAITAFQALGNYQDSEYRAKQCRYGRAEQYLSEGAYELAYEVFHSLGSFEDSDARAAGCHFAFPATGILYQDPAYYYDMCAIDIDYRYTAGGSYYKIYSGEKLVATLFLNANSTARVYLSPGSYVVKEGTGDRWFGEELAFGTSGWYTTMIYDDTGNEYLTLNHNDLVTLTMNASDNANITERGESLSSF